MNLAQAKDLDSGYIRSILSVPNTIPEKKKKTQVNKTNVEKRDLVADGTTYRAVNFTYYLSNTNMTHQKCLIDRGDNGGVYIKDVRLMSKNPDKMLDVIGIGNHKVNSISIVTSWGAVNTTVSPIVAILHQYAHIAKCHSIHSSIQIDHFKNTVDEKSIKEGSK